MDEPLDVDTGIDENGSSHSSTGLTSSYNGCS